MEKIIFKVNNNPDIAFVGKEVAYEHDKGKDVAYRMYETQKGGWFFAAITNKNILLNHMVFESKSTEELVKFLGYTDLAKSIYSQLDIDTTKNLDI
ncbi:TPA: hypothetical protein ACSTJE_001497 [Serratia fonticola]